VKLVGLRPASSSAAIRVRKEASSSLWPERTSPSSKGCRGWVPKICGPCRKGGTDRCGRDTGRGGRLERRGAVDHGRECVWRWERWVLSGVREVLRSVINSKKSGNLEVDAGVCDPPALDTRSAVLRGQF
jgi:hypothetical protein